MCSLSDSVELRAELARLEAVPVSASDSEECMVPCLQSVRGYIEQIRDIRISEAICRSLEDVTINICHYTLHTRSTLTLSPQCQDHGYKQRCPHLPTQHVHLLVLHG